MHLLLKTIKSQESGISLILSMVILVAIFGLVIAVADVAFDIRASNKSIGASEIALFAAETAAEKTIYEVEFKDRGFSDTMAGIIELPDNDNDASWSSEIQLSTTTPGLCKLFLPDGTPSLVSPSPVCTDFLGPVIVPINPLKVRLEQKNWSFQLDLDLEGAESFYPDYIYVRSLSGGPGDSSLIISGGGEQYIILSPFIENVPDSNGTDTLNDPDGNYKIRIINNSNFPQNYEIAPVGIAGELLLGLEIRAKGTYMDTERNITLIRPAWLIY